MKKSAVLLLLLVLLTGCGTGNSTPMPDSSSAQEESIHIQPEELLLSVGETASLVCQNASEQSVTDVHWTIEDENVATISSDGTVTAVEKAKRQPPPSGMVPSVYRRVALSQFRRKKCSLPTEQR